MFIFALKQIIMEKVNLISMVDFVLKNDQKASMGGHYDKVVRYANFLNTPLNLGMFVPAIEVNGKWVVLEEPTMIRISLFQTPRKSYEEFQIEYQQAKGKVIFEGFEVRVTSYNNKQAMFKDGIYFCAVNNLLINYKTIQDLIKYAPTLTEYGKQISGLNK